MIPIPRSAKDRALILERCASDTKYRKQVIDQCALPGPASVIFWVNTFLWTQTREDEGSALVETPFILYPFQEDLIRRLETALQDLDDLWVDKSRDMGVTITFAAWGLHGWIFRPGWHGLLGSNKESKVDNRTFDSHFGKLDYFIDRLPGWFIRDCLPGFDRRKHRQKLKLVNPSRAFPGVYGNTLLGDSSNPNFGRGDRKTFAYIDEGATFERFGEAWMALAQTTKSRFTFSTPYGMNIWGQMVHHPENQHRRVTLHWRLHPLHDDAWYEGECRRLIIPEHIAREIDLSYRESGGGLVYPTWDDCLFGVYERDPKQQLYVSWDAGLDMTALIWWQRDAKAGVVTMLDCYQNKDKPISWFTPFVTGILPTNSLLARQYTPLEVAKIAEHATWGIALHFGDPSLKQRDVGTGLSPAAVLAVAGIHVVTPDTNDMSLRRKSTMEGLVGLQVNLPGPEFPIGCEDVDAAMRDARLQTRRDDSQSSAEPSPIHDDSSHFRSSLEYFFRCLPKLRSFRRPEAYRQVLAYEALNKTSSRLPYR